MLSNYQPHTRENMIVFRSGVNVNDLLDFYNDPSFHKGGKRIYNPRNGVLIPDDLRDAGVMFLNVPDQVLAYLDSRAQKLGPSGGPSNEIPISTDALITLASIDGLGEMNEDEFVRAATRKTVEGLGVTYDTKVLNYLDIFPSLLMTQSADPKPALLSSYRPNKQVLADYTVLGVVPAPLVDPNGNLDERIISLSIFHQKFNLEHTEALRMIASPEAIRGLYAPFVR